MRGLPNMTVIVPADDIETRQATIALGSYPGPAYLRLGRYPTPRLFAPDYQFVVGKVSQLREGKDIVIFACGHMTAKALEAAELLAHDHIEARVINVSTIKPLDQAAVLAAVKTVGYAFSVEEHNVIGGLGSAIAETLSQRPTIPLMRLGVQDQFGESGLADELLEKHGLQATGIQKSIIAALSAGKAAG